MEVKVPQWLEKAVSLALPPDARECVLGDLQERLRMADPRRASRQFLADAAGIVPALIASRLRRTVGSPLLCAEAFLLLTLFLAAAFSAPWIQGLDFLVDEHGAVRLIVPALVAFFAITAIDTYRASGGNRLRVQFGEVACALTVALFVNAVTSLIAPAWAVPRGMMVWGSVLAHVFLPVLRWATLGTADAPSRARVWIGYAASLWMDQAVSLATLVRLTVVAYLVFVAWAIAMTSRDPIACIGAYLCVAAGLRTLWQWHHLGRPGRTVRIVVLLLVPTIMSIGQAVTQPTLLPSLAVWIVGFFALAMASRPLRSEVDPS